MPELNFESLDKVPEGLREYAAETEDGSSVQVNVVPKNKLDEFRENNIKLSQQRDELDQQIRNLQGLVGDDPDAFKKQLEELQQTKKRVEDGELVENTSLDEAVAKRTQEMRSDYEGKIKALQQEQEAWKSKANEVQSRYNRSLIDRHITDAVLDAEVGAEPAALPDILRRAYDTFKVKDDGSIVPMDGDQVLYGADGASPMDPKEWLKAQRNQSPHLFKSSSGGGAPGAGGSGGGLNGKLSPEEIANLSMDQYRKARKEGRI